MSDLLAEKIEGNFPLVGGGLVIGEEFIAGRDGRQGVAEFVAEHGEEGVLLVRDFAKAKFHFFLLIDVHGDAIPFDDFLVFVEDRNGAAPEPEVVTGSGFHLEPVFVDFPCLKRVAPFCMDSVDVVGMHPKSPVQVVGVIFLESREVPPLGAEEIHNTVGIRGPNDLGKSLG